ncbi:MAG: F0F1 ATP synthase subunit A [Planctomycetota bacterium]|jgi:F-type H+-transporting ATPase subunit a
MEINPDNIILWQIGAFPLNVTIVFTWLVMIIMVGFSWLVSRRLVTMGVPSRKQGILEVLVSGINRQIREVSNQDPEPYLPFVGTLFLYIAVSNVLSVVPYFYAPTRSLTTSAALAVCVFFAVPVFGIRKKGLKGYFRNYIKPTPFMLPFNIMGELSRTLALAVRLFGNMMSGAMIVGILLMIIPYVFPIVMNLLGLLTGLIQAYIFAVLAMVYIASATRVQEETEKRRIEKEIEREIQNPEGKEQ